MEGFLNKVSRETRSAKFQNNGKHHSNKQRDHGKQGYSRKTRRSWKSQINY